MIETAILGATGFIGQQFARLLDQHPIFELSKIYASSRSAGKKLEDRWSLPHFEIPASLKEMIIDNIEDLDENVDIVFSALPSRYAKEIEHKLRMQGIKVFSNASAHRMEDDVPILIPEINPSHIDLINLQQERLGTDGYIITNSNCSAAGAAVYLGELDKLTNIKTAVISTYQAMSGAGVGGVAGTDILGNVIPNIPNEEPKIIQETQKILGRIKDGKVQPHKMEIVANAARVNVSDGHLEAITTFSEENIQENYIRSLYNVQSPLLLEKYHIAPVTHLNYMKKPDRPQPRLDVFKSEYKSSKGMTVHFGRTRIKNKSISSYVLSHNTIRGGAGGSVLNAEYAYNMGVL